MLACACSLGLAEGVGAWSWRECAGDREKSMESVAGAVAGAGTGRKDDPRRRTKVHAYEEEVIDEDQLPPDYWSLLSLLFSVLGLMLRVSKVPKDSACV